MSINIGTFQVNMVTNIQVIKQKPFSNAKVMVIGVGRDLRIKMFCTTFTNFGIKHLVMCMVYTNVGVKK